TKLQYAGRSHKRQGVRADHPHPSPIMRSYLPVWAWTPRGDMPAEEVAHEPSDQVPVAFQREVAGVEQVELYRLEVSLVRLGPGRRKDLVVPAPHNQHRRLILPEVFLPLRIEWRGYSPAPPQ